MRVSWSVPCPPPPNLIYNNFRSRGIGKAGGERGGKASSGMIDGKVEKSRKGEGREGREANWGWETSPTFYTLLVKRIGTYNTDEISSYLAIPVNHIHFH